MRNRLRTMGLSLIGVGVLLGGLESYHVYKRSREKSILAGRIEWLTALDPDKLQAHWREQTSWPIASPAQTDIALRPFEDLSRKCGQGSQGCCIKDGAVVYQWGNPYSRGNWGSAHKALLSTMLLFALSEGRIDSLDAPLRLPDSLKEKAASHPEVTEITYRQVSSMYSAYGLPERPGSAWAYNDYNYHLFGLGVLGGIYGLDPTDAQAFEQLVTDPARLGRLGFEDPPLFREVAGLPRATMSARDMARVGQFWLNRGKWEGIQLLPDDFFDRYVCPQVPPDLPETRGREIDDVLGIGPSGGQAVSRTPEGPGVYGMGWWFNRDRKLWPSVPEDAFVANGHWNQQIVLVIPSLRIVLTWRDAVALKSRPEEANRDLNNLLSSVVSMAAQ